MIALLGVFAVVAACNVYLAWHFFERFKRRHHPLSIVAATRQLWPLLACCLTLHPALSSWRSLVLSLAVLDGIQGAFTVYVTRDAEKRLKDMGLRK